MLKRVLLTFLGLLTAGAVGAPAVFALFGSRAPISQPVAFNHRLHVQDNGLECVDCHIYVMTQTFAGLPRVEKCLECHEEDQSGSPEEEKIRQAAANGQELAWNRVYQMPDHVYSSHRRHVVAGKLACADCHGPIAAATSPPPRPLNDISMDFCMDCHQQNGVTNECIACHM